MRVAAVDPGRPPRRAWSVCQRRELADAAVHVAARYAAQQPPGWLAAGVVLYHESLRSKGLSPKA